LCRLHLAVSQDESQQKKGADQAPLGLSERALGELEAAF
jgi:hypothetical protein